MKWESTTSYDVGLDYGILNERLGGSIDWYDKHTENLIVTVPTPAGSNLSNYVTTNIGKMKNTGVDLNLSARPQQGAPGAFSWNAAFNAAHNTNELDTITPTTTAHRQTQAAGSADGP